MNSTPSEARCYIAYPIDQTTFADEFYERINKASAGLRDLGIGVTYDPGDAFTVTPGTKPDPYIAMVNRAALDGATHVLAYVPKGAATVGVPMEIERAAAKGKWVAVVTNVDSWSLQSLDENVRIFYADDEGEERAVSWLASRAPTGTTGEPLPVLARTPAARLPTRGYEDDAGLDLYVSEKATVPPDAFVDVSCGLGVQLPEWGWGLITGRSSALRKRGLMVNPGIIDSQYRGELFTGVFNLTREIVVIEPGERIAQLIVMPNLTKDLAPTWVDWLRPTARGENGFGSTG